MSDPIADILSLARDIPLLNTGVGTVATESTYPTKEHPSLLTHKGKPSSTPLNSLLAARTVKIPTDRNDPHYKSRHKLEKYKKNALSLSFKGHRNAPVARVEWEEYYLHMLPLILEHPKRLLSESKQLTNTMSKLYKASSDYIGDASLNIEQQATLKTRSLCLPIIAENPWNKADDEEDQVEAIVLEEMGLAVAPTQQNPEELRKFGNLKVQYTRALSFIRELTNHTFLRVIYHTSTRQAQLEFKEVQHHFLNEHANDAPDAEPAKFTAQHIIDYIENTCTCENNKSLVHIQNSINKMLRHTGMTPLAWLLSFQPLINRYKKAIGQNDLNDEEQKTLWKEHFAKQLNVEEHQRILTFQTQHLSTAEKNRIKQLPDGKFDENVLHKLFTKLSDSFNNYSPDKTVMSYLHQHANSLGWEHKLDFRSPKEKTNIDRPDKTTKRKRLKDKETSRKRKTRIPNKEQCRRQRCRQKGTHVNHKHSECNFANGDKTKHPNLGKAPQKKKKQKNVSTSSQKPFQNAPKANPDKRRCFICNSEDHLANTCPQKEANKKRAQDKLKKDKNFMAIWQNTFESQEQQECATRMLQAWDEDNLCPKCIKPLSFSHRCDANDAPVCAQVSKVRSAIADSSLLQHIQDAHYRFHPDHESESSITMDSNFFVASREQGSEPDSDSRHNSSEQNDSESNKEDETDDSDDSSYHSNSESESAPYTDDDSEEQ